MILNWPERIKTQPHDDRDNCFPPLDSKGSCGMTVNNDIDDDSATKHGDSHTPVTLIVRVPDRRDLIPQGAPSCRTAINLNGRFCPNHQHYHQESSFPFCFCILQRTDSSVGIKSSQHDRRHSLNRSLRIRLVRQSATMQLVSIHLTMSG